MMGVPKLHGLCKGFRQDPDLGSWIQFDLSDEKLIEFQQKTLTHPYFLVT